MIYTLTTNPFISYGLKIPFLKSGAKIKSEGETVMAGGRGFNISRALNILGVENRALGFAGGVSGKLMENILEYENVKSNLIWCENNTRISLKLFVNEDVTNIAGDIYLFTEEECDKMLAEIKKAEKGDLVILSGYAYNDITYGLYEKIADYCNKNSVLFALDCDGPTLRSLLNYQPFFVKPTNRELGDVFDTTILTNDAVYNYGSKLIEMGAENVIVSMADREGPVYFNKEGTYKSNLPQGLTVNTDGTGDSMVGGFIGAYAKTGDLMAAFKQSVAAGSATAYSEGLFSIEKLNNLLDDVIIEKYR